MKRLTFLRISVVFVVLGILASSLFVVGLSAKEKQPIGVTSKNSFDNTLSKLKSAITGKELMIVFETNHKNMLSMIGVESKNSVTIGIGRPQMGQMVLMAEPRAALEMPMRIAVREMDDGKVIVLYYKPSYLFSHYENPKLEPMGKEMDMMIASFVEAATK